MIDGCPVFFTRHELNHIQELLAKNYNDYNWHLIKKIDEQTGGKYPHNYTW
jgi:hypothetical protein